MAANAAIRASETATAAVTTASKALLVASAAGRGLLGLLTGPVGLIAMTGAVAYSFLSVGDRADDASKSLISHNATVSETLSAYKALSAEQQRLQKSLGPTSRQQRWTRHHLPSTTTPTR